MATEITTIQISAKCSDLCNVMALDNDGTVVAEGDGYVPGFMPGEHYGDYVQLDIDVATGMITNWRTPSQRTIRKDLKEM